MTTRAPAFVHLPNGHYRCTRCGTITTRETNHRTCASVGNLMRRGK